MMKALLILAVASICSGSVEEKTLKSEELCERIGNAYYKPFDSKALEYYLSLNDQEIDLNYPCYYAENDIHYNPFSPGGSTNVRLSPLILAARYLDLELLQMFLSNKRVDVNWEDANGATVLHHMVKSSRLENLQELLNRSETLGIDVNKGTYLGFSDQNQLLLPPSRLDVHGGMTPAIVFAKYGKSDHLREILKHPSYKEKSDFQGWNLYHHAISNCNGFHLKDTLKVIYESNKTDINALNAMKDAPIHLFNFENRYGMKTFLALEGVDVNNVLDRNGCNALLTVILDTIKYKVDFSRNETDGKIYFPHTMEFLSILIDSGKVTNYNAVDYNYGKSALHLAATNCGAAYFINNYYHLPVDINIRDLSGKLAYEIAMERGCDPSLLSEWNPKKDIKSLAAKEEITDSAGDLKANFWTLAVISIMLIAF